jgi:methylation protein EvaC
MVQCKGCGQTMPQKVGDLGLQPLANNFTSIPHPIDEYFFHLEAFFCQFCFLFQLKTQPQPDLMFHENYKFHSKTSSKMVEHFALVSNELKISLQNGISSKPQVIFEIGSNDGIFLQNFLENGYKPIGIDPSLNVSRIAQRLGIQTVPSFFSKKIAEELLIQYGKSNLIFAANVICHVSEIMDLLSGIEILLDESGIFVFEEPYLGDVLKLGSYDQIYDEHVFLFSAHSVNKLAELCNLKLINVEPINTHGGSMRYTVGHRNMPVHDKVYNLLNKEKSEGVQSLNKMIEFFEKVAINSNKIRSELEILNSKGLKVYGYGATSKSTTILNYADIGPNLIKGIFDNTPDKIGLYSPGKHIPILSYSEIDDHDFDVLVLFAWNHKIEIFEKEKLRNGGKIKWLVPFPEAHFE